MNNHCNLFAISPVDGRYYDKTQDLQSIFSEYGLIKFRVLVEIKWLIHLANTPTINQISPLSKQAIDFLNNLIVNFSLTDAQKIKEIEKITNHDVKAVEYFLKDQIKNIRELNNIAEFIHFSATSEDINNLCHGLMLKTGIEQVIKPAWLNLINYINRLAIDYADLPLMAKTHGQPATPTTVGKELANFVFRLNRQYQQLCKQQYLGKFNGAVGNFNAHLVAYPQVDWQTVSSSFIQALGLEINPYTTQIEPHDYMAELFDTVARFNNILLDLDRDIWGYISFGIFKQKTLKNEVGSSTMPHKVNPIDYENSEGNLGIANTLLNHFSNKLTISRFQRDLSDSTVIRNLGLAFAYSLIAYQATLKGLKKILPNEEKILQELEQNWELLAEPIQTVMRKHGIANSYEKLKELTRGKRLTKEDLHNFIRNLDLDKEEIEKLLQLTPSNYIGAAAQLAKQTLD